MTSYGDQSMTPSDFISAVRSLDDADTLDAVFQFLGLEARLIDVAVSRHTELMLQVSGLASGRPAQSDDATVVRYLAPEAAFHGQLRRAKELVEAVADPYYRAHGYREIFLMTHGPADLTTYISAGAGVGDSKGFRLGDGNPTVPLAHNAILVDGLALAIAHGFDDIASEVSAQLPADQVAKAEELSDRDTVSEAGARKRRLRELAEGSF